MTAKKLRTGRIIEITAETAGRLRHERKMTLHYSKGTALDLMHRRRKRVIYQLPNGVFGVMI